MISLVRLQYAFIHYFFFFNDTATTEIYTLSLHDALPISQTDQSASLSKDQAAAAGAISAEETRMPRALKQQEKSEARLKSAPAKPAANKERVRPEGAANDLVARSPAENQPSSELDRKSVV